ncbi:MAG: hypothetical protein WBB23_23890, partial [Desulforhopalus sp.]
ITKAFISRKVLSYEIIAFSSVIVFIWFNEVFDLPYVLFGAETTPVNWRESLFETLIIALLGLVIIRNTKALFQRMKYLEDFLPICSSCKKIRDEQGKWQQIETYIHNRSGTRFSHGLCPNCAIRIYPDVFTESNYPGATSDSG